MKTLAKASRVNTALEVIKHMNTGMTVVDACDEVGVPRSTFYDLVKKNPEAITEYQEMVEANARHQLGLILLNKTSILERVIEDGLSDQTTPRDRLSIFKALTELEVGLSQASKIEKEAAKHAHEFLREGPVTSKKVSRLIATQLTVTIED